MVGSSNFKSRSGFKLNLKMEGKLLGGGGGMGGGILPKNSAFDSILCPHSVKVIDSLESLIF